MKRGAKRVLSALHDRCVCIFASHVIRENATLSNQTLRRFTEQETRIYGPVCAVRAPESYLYYPLLGAHPWLLSVLCMSPTVSPSSPADSHNWSAAPWGATFTETTTQKKKTICGLKRISLALSSVPFLDLLFCTPKKVSGSSLECFFFCSTLAALLFFFHYLVRFSSSLCLPLHRSQHQLFLLLLLLLLPLAHIDSLLSVRHGLKNLTDVR